MVQILGCLSKYLECLKIQGKYGSPPIWLVLEFQKSIKIASPIN